MGIICSHLLAKTIQSNLAITPDRDQGGEGVLSESNIGKKKRDNN